MKFHPRAIAKHRARIAAAKACRHQGQRVCRACGEVRAIQESICAACGGKGFIQGAWTLYRTNPACALPRHGGRP